MSDPSALVHPTAYIFVVLALAGALLAVALRNILHAIFGLALALFSLAALFLYLGSPFVAAMQVVIYVGGISVAMVFAVMFAYSLGVEQRVSKRHGLALIPALLFCAAIGWLLHSARFERSTSQTDGSVAAVGRALLTHYNLVFEALSVVLLLAIIGAIVIARRKEVQR